MRQGSFSGQMPRTVGVLAWVGAAWGLDRIGMGMERIGPWFPQTRAEDLSMKEIFRFELVLLAHIFLQIRCTGKDRNLWTWLLRGVGCKMI